MNTIIPVIVIGVLVSIVATIVLYVMVVPDKKGATLPKFAQILHKIFNFESLMIEKLLRALYIFLTVLCVCIGFFMLFGFTDNAYVTIWYGGYGLLIMILGPILIRIIFESMMMFILIVKNVIQINNKLKYNSGEIKKDPEISAEE